MKKITGLLSIIVLLLLAATASAATTTTASDSSSAATQDASSLVVVSSVSTNPEVFFPYEVGTITVTLTNSGTTSVGLSNPDILSDKVHIMKQDAWNTISYIGPGSTISYSFSIRADPPDGTTYAMFSIGTKDGGSIHSPIVIKVDSTDIRAYVSEAPGAFTRSAKENVNLTIINPRSGGIKNLQIIPSGTGIVATPSTRYISLLGGQNSTDVSFGVTAEQESNLTFQITYDNGDTRHSANVILPVTFGTDKSAAVPTVNNVALTSQGASFDVTGDVTNTGISDANGLVVTVGPPARGTGTYPEYAIGSLASDDSSSFEVTFTCNNLSSVPLVFNWKDDDGDDYSVTKILDLRSSAGVGNAIAGNTSSTASRSSGGPQDGFQGMAGRSSTSSLFTGNRGNGISSFYPVIAAGIILVVSIVLWKKRKWLSAKLKKR